MAVVFHRFVVSLTASGTQPFWKQMSQNTSQKPITRKDFLKLLSALGGSIVLAPILNACQRLGLIEPTATSQPTMTSITPTSTVIPSPTDTAVPVETVEEGVARLAFVKTRDRATGIQEAIKLLAVNPVEGKRVLLKPNFNSADPAPASTHPTTLRTLVETLQEMGAQHITLADRSGMGNSHQVMQVLGVVEMAKELGFELLSFEDLQSEADWEMMQFEGCHWQNGFPFARPVLEANAVVQTCCLKPHRFGGHFTMSLKNTIGMVGKYRGSGGHNYMTELHSSPYQRLMIAEANTAYTPALVVLDGVEAFIDNGPDMGTKVWGDAIIAGTDRIAIDAVGLALLRFLGYRDVAANGSIFQHEQIARAVELGLGIDSSEKIRFLTSDAESKAYVEQLLEFLV
jgi:uncharacterized protein (DUF362 family)